MLRELHTRFGRNNIGYLWLILEPMILSAGISVAHIFSKIPLPFGFDAATFYASGYIVFIIYRNNTGRACFLVESNKPLLYHKRISLFDISWSRSILDGVASAGAMIIMLSAFCLLGLGSLPERPWYIVAAIFLMTWLSGSVAMLISAASAVIHATERFIHPLNYLMLPVTGMLFVLPELPPHWARALSFLVIPQITDIARLGLKATFEDPYVNVGYIIGANSVLTLLGGLSLRVVRKRIHFE